VPPGDDSRRGSMNKMASGMASACKSVSDSTKKATNKAADSTKQFAKDAGASSKKRVQDVAELTSKGAKDAFNSAFSGLSWGEKFTVRVSKWSQSWVTHVAMLLLLAGYTMLGGAMFLYLEGDDEKLITLKQKAAVSYSRDELLRELYGNCNDNQKTWMYKAKKAISPHELVIIEKGKDARFGYENGFNNFWKSTFFSSTIISTIGYGHMSPSTFWGQFACIMYALVGIPVMLIVLADFGKVLVRGLRFIFKKIDQARNSACWRRVTTSAPVKMVKRFLRKIKKTICFCKRKSKEEEEKEEEDEDKDGAPVPEDVLHLPVKTALITLVVYIGVGCLIFPLWENWSPWEAFYFVFISISTVGFGDIVPQHPGFAMGTTLYFLFGLSLAAMCIDIIKDKLSLLFAEAKEKMSAKLEKMKQEEAEKKKLKEIAEEEKQNAEENNDGDETPKKKKDSKTKKKFSLTGSSQDSPV